MKEGQEILTSKEKFELIDRRPFLFIVCISVLSVIFVIILSIIVGLWVTNLTISEVRIDLCLYIFSAGLVLSGITGLMILFGRYERNFEYYTVNYFNDRIIIKRHTAELGQKYQFKENHLLNFNHIISIYSKNDFIYFELYDGILDYNNDKSDPFWRISSVTSKIEGLKFRYSRNLKKQDRKILLDFINVQISKSKEL